MVSSFQMKPGYAPVLATSLRSLADYSPNNVPSISHSCAFVKRIANIFFSKAILPPNESDFPYRIQLRVPERIRALREQPGNRVIVTSARERIAFTILRFVFGLPLFSFLLVLLRFHFLFRLTISRFALLPLPPLLVFRSPSRNPVSSRSRKFRDTKKPCRGKRSRANAFCNYLLNANALNPGQIAAWPNSSSMRRS